MTVRVEILQTGRQIQLTEASEEVIYEMPATIKIQAPHGAVISFDDELADAVWVDINLAVLQVDLTNAVGYHRIAISSTHERLEVDFRTDSTKATWEQAQEMARQVGRHAFLYRRQFVYATPGGPRRAVAIPEFEFGWFRDRMEEITRLVDSISDSPATIDQTHTELSFTGSRISVAATYDFLREHPRMLEEAADGPIVFDDRHYWPTAVRSVTKRKRPVTAEHAQVAVLLRKLAVACQRLISAVPNQSRPAVHLWAARLSRARSRPIIKSNDMPGRSRSISAGPSRTQILDKRYRRLREIDLEYSRDFSVGSYDNDAMRANVKDISEIFQSFTAHMVGHALGLQYVSSEYDLRDRDRMRRSMRSQDIDLYYDVTPPSEILTSWRSHSTRPAIERPDILLHDRVTNRIAIIDAKFRKDSTGDCARSEDLFEMQGYLHSFSLRRGAIAFPSRKPSTESVAGDGNEILEIPIWADADSNGLPERLCDAIARIWNSAEDQ